VPTPRIRRNANVGECRQYVRGPRHGSVVSEVKESLERIAEYRRRNCLTQREHEVVLVNQAILVFIDQHESVAHTKHPAYCRGACRSHGLWYRGALPQTGTAGTRNSASCR
jgi:hypothetical protein